MDDFSHKKWVVFCFYKAKLGGHMLPHSELTKWVEQMAKLCEPDRVYWVDGSDQENESFFEELVEQKESIKT